MSAVRIYTSIALAMAMFAACGATCAEDPPTKTERFTYRVFGLFSPDREEDIRELFKELPEITLTAISFEEAEITVEFNPSKAFPGVKPDRFIELLDNKVRALARGTFAVKPRRVIAKVKLQQLVIPVLGLDCKACSFAAYETIAKIDGVEQATASFKKGQVTALIDPTKTDRAALENALRKRGISIGNP